MSVQFMQATIQFLDNLLTEGFWGSVFPGTAAFSGSLADVISGS